MNLGRFVAAQDAVWPQVEAELAAGAKRTHWMWFVFPQVAGLGRSGMAQRFALSDAAEARAYLAHPVLGRRLVECARALTALMAAGGAARATTVRAIASSVAYGAAALAVRSMKD